MSDWVKCRLLVEGEEKEIEKLVEFVFGEDCDGNEGAFDLNKIVPMPEELNETTFPTPEDQKELQKSLKEKYGSGNWYEWKEENWGTPSNTREATYINDEEGKSFYFETIYSPAFEAVRALAAKFPLLRFEFLFCSLEREIAGSMLLVEGVSGNYEEQEKDRNNPEYMRIAKMTFCDESDLYDDEEI